MPGGETTVTLSFVFVVREALFKVLDNICHTAHDEDSFLVVVAYTGQCSSIFLYVLLLCPLTATEEEMATHSSILA